MAIAHDPPPPRPSGTRVKFFYGSLLVMALVAIGLGWFWFRGLQSASRKVFSERQITDNLSDDTITGSEISPDGKHLAYADSKGLHLSAIESGESHDIALPDELRTKLLGVTWFPDGEKLIIDVYNEPERHVLWLISIFGGAPRKLRTDSSGSRVSPDGSSIVFKSNDWKEIWVTGADGENARKIMDGQSEACRSLAWSPEGKRFAYVKSLEKPGLDVHVGGNIETLSLDGGSSTVVVSDSGLYLPGGLAWLRDGRLIYLSEGPTSRGVFSLWEIMTDLRTGLPSGKPVKVTNWSGAAAIWPSVSSDGKRLAVVKRHSWSDIYVGELKESGTRLDSSKRLTSTESYNYSGTWTRDSGTILFTSDRMGRSQIFKQRFDTEIAEVIVKGQDDQWGAVLSPDATWILYLSLAHGGNSRPTSGRLMRFAASGGLPEQVLETPVDPMMWFDCPSRPSNSCIISHGGQGQLIFYALDPIRGQGIEVIRTKLEQATNLNWTISPDGSHIAVSSRDQLREQIRILDLRDGTERNLQLPKGGIIVSLCWTADGNSVFVSLNSARNPIARIDLDGKTHILFEGRNEIIEGLSASPDGRHLAYSQNASESNVWLLENF